MTYRSGLLACSAIMVLLGCAGNAPLEIPGFPGAKMTDAEQVATVLERVQAAMEARHTKKIMAYVSPNYSDSEGRDQAAMEVYLDTIFKNYREIRIERMRPRVVVQGTRAQAIETFGTIGTPFSSSDCPPLSLQGEVAVDLEKVGNAWLIISWGNVR